jgi:iron complex outermembrane receptor protein
MKSSVCVFLFVLMGNSFLQVANAAEADTNNPSTSIQDTEAHIQDLQKALSDAKARVSSLEAELSDAQKTIKQLDGQSANQVVDTAELNDAEETTHAVNQTVHDHPVYDANNPKRPIVQRDVISEKFSPDVQNQPIAITRLIDDDIERGGIRHLDRVAPLVPNMQYGQSGNEARVAIRGARTNRTGAEAEQAVAIFEDGVSVPTTTQAMGPYVDIKSIEVLRGPQGTLYGRNAFGGVINVISNEPNLKGWEAALEGTIGYADGTRFEAMLNVPILDTLATRVAARSDVHSGYVNNHVLDGDADDLRDRKQQFVRWMTTWQPSDKFSLAVNIASLDQNQTGSGMWGYQQIGALVDGEYLGGHQFAPDNAQADKGPRNLRRNMASLEDQENLSGTLKTDWDIGFANMQWYINKSKFENQQVFDSDYSDGGDIYDSDFNGWDSLRDTLSSELRLISNSTGRFDWQAGLYWLDMESKFFKK